MLLVAPSWSLVAVRQRNESPVTFAPSLAGLASVLHQVPSSCSGQDK